MIYAEEIYSSLKSALYTSSNIEEEMMEERALLAKNIAQKSNYHYSSHYARDNPDVHKYDYMDKASRSKRKVRLTQNNDGETTFTVFRRDSLERNTDYTPHDDADYQYADRRNEVFANVSRDTRHKDKGVALGRGEKIYRQTITDYDREFYSKNLTPGEDRMTKHDRHTDAHSQRFTVNSHRDIDADLYYGDLNDVTRREETIVSSYPTVSPEYTFGTSSRSAQKRKGLFAEELAPENVRTFRRTAHIPRKKVNRAIYAPVVDDSELDGYYSSRTSRNTSNAVIDDGIEVTIQEEPMYHTDEVNIVQRSTAPVNVIHHAPEPTNYSRRSVAHDMAAVAQPPQIRRESTYVERDPAVIQNYRMTERESIRPSVIERPSLSPINGNGVTRIKDTKYDTFNSPDSSIAKRHTTYTTDKKRTINERDERDMKPLNNLDLSVSF